MLSGGHHNSLGHAVEVVDIILGDKGALDAHSLLVMIIRWNGAFTHLRLLSVFLKRILIGFIDYVDRFHDRIPRLGQPSC